MIYSFILFSFNNIFSENYDLLVDAITFNSLRLCSIKIFSKYFLNFQDISKLTPLSPEVISRQATINIGTIGHVAHGKSTVVKAISGVQTVRFKNELERNITIKLGKFFQNLIFETNYK